MITTSLEQIRKELADFIKYEAMYGEEVTLSPDTAKDILDILNLLKKDPRPGTAPGFEWYTSIEKEY